MSDYMKCTGKLKKVEADNLIDFAGKYLIEHANNILEDDPLEQLLEEYHDEFLMVNDTLYEILELEEDYKPSHDYCNLHENADGTISFDTMFYNGGTCFSEMVEDKLKKVNKEK